MKTWREWLTEALARRGRKWGRRPISEPDLSHGSPAFKRYGSWPVDAKPIVTNPEPAGTFTNQFRNRTDESLEDPK